MLSFYFSYQLPTVYTDIHLSLKELNFTLKNYSKMLTIFNFYLLNCLESKF